jgi:hypothetical protein
MEKGMENGKCKCVAGCVNMLANVLCSLKNACFRVLKCMAMKNKIYEGYFVHVFLSEK